MHGYDIIRELASRTRGIWRPSSGSVYPTLQRLKDQGLLTSHSDAGRRLFSLTEAGRAAAVDRPRPGPPWEDVLTSVDQVVLRLQDAIAELEVAVVRIVEDGTEAQHAEALKVLGDTRRSLYAALADDE